MEKTSLIISELLPNPLGSDTTGEWIELYNPGNETVVLAGFFITDASGKKFTFTDGQIAPGNFFVITRPTTKISLNNDSDTITLFDAQGAIVDTFAYSFSSSLAQDVSLVRDKNGENQLTSAPTPGAKNIFATVQKNTNSSSSDVSLAPSFSTSTQRVFSLSDSTTTQVLFSSHGVSGALGLALFLGVISGCVTVALFRMFFADFSEG